MTRASSSSPWRHPLRALRARLTRWWLQRLPLSDNLTLTQHNVYILPTGAGLMLALTLLVLLLASINYQLNLGYLLTFLLAGSALAGMHIGHGTLRGLGLQVKPPEPVFLGTPATFSVQLDNPRKQPRHGIGLATLEGQDWVWTDVAAQSSSQLQLAFRPTRRGLQHLPTLTLETRFPIGTFRVWTLWRPAAELLVYPTPETPAPPLPRSDDEGTATLPRQTQGTGEADGLRPYRRGDALKAIVWKKAAKTGELVSREQLAHRGQTLWLEQQRTGLSLPEAQLSRLCAWVLLAERLGLVYGLRLRGQEISPASGAAHQQRCLQALALA